MQNLQNGAEIELAKCKLSKDGIVIRKGLIKKTPHFIKWDEIQIDFSLGGSFMLRAPDDRKAFMSFSYHETINSRVVESVVYGMTMGRLKR